MTTLKTSVHEPQYIFTQFCHKYFNAHMNVPHSLHPMNTTHTLPVSGLISLGKYTWVNSLFYILIPHRSKLLSYSQDSLSQVHLGAEQQRQRWKGFVKRRAVLIWGPRPWVRAETWSKGHRVRARKGEWGLGWAVRDGALSEVWDAEWELGCRVRAGHGVRDTEWGPGWGVRAGTLSEGRDLEWGLGCGMRAGMPALLPFAGRVWTHSSPFWYFPMCERRREVVHAPEILQSSHTCKGTLKGKKKAVSGQCPRQASAVSCFDWKTKDAGFWHACRRCVIWEHEFLGPGSSWASIWSFVKSGDNS